MKKTLFTLFSMLALSSASQAATTIYDFTSSTTNGHSNQATAGGFTFNLSSDRLTTTSSPSGASFDEEVILKEITWKWSPTTTGQNVQSYIVLVDSSNNVLFSTTETVTCTQNGTCTIDFGGTTIEDSMIISSTDTYKILFMKESQTVGVTVELNSNTLTASGLDFANYNGTTSDGKLNCITNTGTDWDGKWAPIVSIKTQTIPEPATASLGVLGLVALMARRRRKA